MSTLSLCGSNNSSSSFTDTKLEEFCASLQEVKAGVETLQSRVAKIHRPSFDPVLRLLDRMSGILVTTPTASEHETGILATEVEAPSEISHSLLEKLNVSLPSGGTLGDLLTSMSVEEVVERLTTESSNPLEEEPVNESSAEDAVFTDTYPELESGHYVFEGFAPLDAAVSVISALNTVNTIMDQANEALSLYDKESQDYLHALELLDLDQYKLDDVVCRLTVARQNRRVVQSFMSLCEPFHDFVQKNQPFLHGIIRTKATMSKIKLGLDGRKYNTRVAKDLQSDFDVVNERIGVSVSSDYPDE